jgi:hypothetical protein
MWKFILAAIVVAIAAVLLFAATRPDTFRVERSVLIQAPAQRIHDQIQDFHHWQAWSPFEKLDPAMKREISGASCGIGALYAWDGNSKAGAGRMEIVESVPGQRVRIRLEFIRPMHTSSFADFSIVPEGNAQRVTWAMHGPQPYISKVMGLVFNMDRMLGKDFDEGLANLKRISERG